MISNKYINIIISIITAIALIFTCFLWINPLGIESESNSNLLYETTVFDKDSIMDVNIDISEDNWNYLVENASDEEYVQANITINGETYYNVGIRAKGNSTLSMLVNSDSERYSFKVKFDEYVEGQTLDGLSKLVLNNVMSDATYMKEYLSYDLLNTIGVNTPLFSYSNISLNGENFGLYFALEPIEEEFITRNYGSLDGNLYKPESMDMNGENMGGGNKDMGNFDPSAMENGEIPDDMNNFDPSNIPNGEIPKDMDNTMDNFDPTNIPDDETSYDSSNIISGNNKPTMGDSMMGNNSNGANLVYNGDDLENYSTVLDSAKFDTTTDSDKELVVEMIKALDEGTNIEEYINVEEVLKYFAVNTFIVNLDSYVSNMNHNYYLYERDGVFEILPWDYNLAFGGYGINSASEAINFPIDTPVTDSTGNSPLIEKLLEVDAYKELYHSYLQEIVDYVNDGTFESIIEKNNNLISSYVKNDQTAFYSYDEYEVALTNLINFGLDRSKSIEAQLNGTQPSTSYGDIETTVNLSTMGTNSVGGTSPPNMGGDAMQKPNANNSDLSIPEANFNIDNNDSETIPDGSMEIPSNNGNMEAPPDMPSMNGNGEAPSNMPTMNGNGETPSDMPGMNNNGEASSDINSTSEDSANTTIDTLEENDSNNVESNINKPIRNDMSLTSNISNNSNIYIYLVSFISILLALIFIKLFNRRKFRA